LKLRPNQRCPIHNGYLCCGRDTIRRRKASKWEQVRPGIQRIRDEHSPDGWRYKFSPAQTEKFVMQKIREQKGLCAICAEPLLDMADVVPDHREPKGMNGSRRDDRVIQAAHVHCNLLKGSQRVS